jgi:hypothetical protein
VTRDPLSVFINVPFDREYSPLLDCLIFCITAAGYRVRCALEVDDSGDIRLEKLLRLINESALSIHDLSRTELGAEDLPRFNMPFELGLAVAAKNFKPNHKSDRIKIMVAKPYKLPAYLSDLGGNDPSAHGLATKALITIVRNFLHETPQGAVLPGPSKLVSVFDRFQDSLPRIAEGIDFRPDEINALQSYRTYLWCVSEFLKSVRV